MEDPKEQYSALQDSAGFRVAKHALFHLALWLLLFSLFAAADSWAVLTGWSISLVLSLLTGLIAGFITVGLAHEWFHFLGARYAGGTYTVNAKPGLFIFDWNFQENSVRQFFTMSIAGSVGSASGLFLLWLATSPDNVGRISLIAGAAASLVFAAIVEWPVLRRTRQSRDPMKELSKITPAVLKQAAMGSAVAGVLCWIALL